MFGKKFPPVVLTFIANKSVLLINDPESVNDIYVSKNKITDKQSRSKIIMYDFFGDSILLDKTTDLLLQKRKSMSAAFYKEKMIKMLNVIAATAFTSMQKWKIEYIEKGKDMVIVKEISKLIMDAIASTVFGLG